jgi:hypothetical protein
VEETSERWQGKECLLFEPLSRRVGFTFLMLRLDVSRWLRMAIFRCHILGKVESAGRQLPRCITRFCCRHPIHEHKHEHQSPMLN